MLLFDLKSENNSFLKLITATEVKTIYTINSQFIDKKQEHTHIISFSLRFFFLFPVSYAFERNIKMILINNPSVC